MLRNALSTFPGEQPLIKPRPVYLNLAQIRLPLPGWVSILHRISGFGMLVIGIPLALYALQQSLASPDAFAELKSLFSHPLAKLVLIGLVWAYLHHFCAGIRFLLLDLDKGIELKPARQSSVIVLAVSIALTLVIGARLW
jgi:succinate dehydrogenase / fumarate reductase cytochrome b subunit